MSRTPESAKAAEPLRVSIFNQPYHLRTDGDGDYLRLLASFVDERMQAISRHTSVVDYAKVAVLAALNIADELHRLKLKTETAAADETQQPSPTPSPTQEQEQPAARAENFERRADSWSYSDIFESLPEGRETLPKLGHNITSRLRQLREEASPATNQEESKE